MLWPSSAYSDFDRPKKPLRIAQIAPLYESVPPKLYGGTERVVACLTEELVRRGHEVTLFASGDSTTKARLRPGWPQALRMAGLSDLGPSCQLPMLSDCYDQADQFDIIHAHLDYWSFPLSRLVFTPTVSTLHGRLDIPRLHPIYNRFHDVPLVSISNAQREPLPLMNWVATVYHGFPRTSLAYSPGPGQYLAFLGRIAPEKRPDWAIEIALRSGLPLKIAAKVDPADYAYYEARIKPLLALSRQIEYIGEIADAQKSEFLGNAIALVFPIDWPEPFGLAMIEALACGTPVLARPCGSIQEILRDGVTGLIRETVDELVAAVRLLPRLSRQACRAEFELRFTAELMTSRYQRVYEAVIDARRETNQRHALPGLAADLFRASH